MDAAYAGPNHAGRLPARAASDYRSAALALGGRRAGTGGAADHVDAVVQELTFALKGDRYEGLKGLRETMTTATSTIEELANREYKYGFITDIDAATVPKGL